MTMDRFSYNSAPGRVIFGRGTLGEIATEAKRLGCGRLLLLSTPFQEQQVRALASELGGLVAGVYAGAQMHTPVNVTDDAMQIVADERIDGLVAFGGGSTIGLGKAVAVRTGLPQIAIPTTYAGSEMTPILGETKDGLKTTRSDPSILPEIVIYDPDLTLSLPAAVSVTSGFNAIAHAVEALYARDRNPIISLMALSGIKALVDGLPRIVDNLDDTQGRRDALYGAWLCGTCLGNVGMALHHKLCHTLGGSFNLPHAETHTVILPHALAFNQAASAEALSGLREFFGQSPAAAIHELAVRLGAPRSLHELGMPRDGIDTAVRLALSNPYWNPRPIEEEGIRTLLTRAWEGSTPHSDGDQQ